MKILYVGDIMAKPGRQVLSSILPKIRKQYKPDIVIAQAENVTHGKGMSLQHMKLLQDSGVDVFSGGNHIVERKGLNNHLADPNIPVIHPANMVDGTPGQGIYIHETLKGKVLITTILGQTFPKSFYDRHPLETVDKILEDYKETKLAAIVINFHGDFSSDKRIIGYYLDGRVSMVIGDHWHVPTSDAMVLPKGTAHITDVGMCGTLHTSLGLDMAGAIERWITNGKIKHDIPEDPPFQFNAVVVDVKPDGLAKSIESINLILESL
jgi:2',3'-cyclic-nucleotide 2'-phosphodiesterase